MVVTLLTLLAQEEIKGLLGADGLLYQTHADMIAVGHELNPAITQFEDSCFTGARVLAKHYVCMHPATTPLPAHGASGFAVPRQQLWSEHSRRAHVLVQAGM